MQFINIKYIIGLVILLSAAGLALALNPSAQADNDLQPPVLPPSCAHLQLLPGNQAFFRAYAIGVQVYRWNGAAWSFVEPLANLYADAGFNGKIGTHYAGPTWESNSGSKVIAAVRERCTPDSNAIPWLLLQAVSTEKPGIFGKVTYIHRVNTTGGLAPTIAGSTVGEEKRVPYTAEYYFYRAED